MSLGAHTVEEIGRTSDRPSHSLHVRLSRTSASDAGREAYGGSASRAGALTRVAIQALPGSRSLRPSHPLGLVRVYSSDGCTGVSPHFRSVAPRIES